MCFYPVLKIIETLIDKGANPNIRDAQGMTPLHVAAREGATNAFQLLVSKGSDLALPDAGGKTAVYWVSVMGHSDMLSFVDRGSVEELTRYDFVQQWSKGRLYKPVFVPKEPEKKKKKKVSYCWWIGVRCSL